MIWHVLEIWLMLLLAFVAGCVLGSLLYLLIAGTPLWRAQEATADGVGQVVDRIRVRFGLTSTWRDRRRNRLARDPEDRYLDYPEPEPDWHDDPPPVYAGAGEEPHPVAAEPAFVEPDPEPDFSEEEWHEAPVAVDPEWHDEDVWVEEDVEAVAMAAPPPATIAPPPGEPREPDRDELPAMRPAGLSTPRNGVPDDLQRIRGIGKKNEELLNSLGVFHFGQIAAWTPAEIRWVGLQIKFPERIERDDWIGQATILASGGRTGYIKAEDRARVAEEEAEAEELRAAARGDTG